MTGQTLRHSLVAATVLVAATAAHADYVQLKDGRYVDDVVVERGADAVVLKYLNGDVRIPLDLVEDFFIDGAPLPEPRTEEEKAKRAEGLVPFRGKWVKPEKRERELAKEREERRASLEEWKKHREWVNRYQFQTRNFVFESTLSEELNEQFSGLLETYFKEFGKLWKVRVPRDWGRLSVFLHYDIEKFHQIGGAGGGTLAYYRFVEPRELHFFHDRRNPANTVAYMFHEANHYLTDLMDDQFQYPHWVNEAMAEYYGASVWDADRKKMVIGGIQQGRLAELLRDMETDDWYPLKDLVSSESRDYRHYYWGWSLVHFLMETKAYRKNFMRFFADLARARDVKRGRDGRNFTSVSGPECLRVFLTRMGLREEDLPELEQEWHAHIRALDADGLQGLEKAGLQAVRQGRIKFRGKRLLKEAIEKGSRSAEVHVAYARCLLAHPDETDTPLGVLRKALEHDPLDASVYAWMAFIEQLKNENEAEGDRLLALAREIEPDEDFIDIEVMMKLGQKIREDD